MASHINYSPMFSLFFGRQVADPLPMLRCLAMSTIHCSLLLICECQGRQGALVNSQIVQKALGRQAPESLAQDLRNTALGTVSRCGDGDAGHWAGRCWKGFQEHNYASRTMTEAVVFKL